MITLLSIKASDPAITTNFATKKKTVEILIDVCFDTIPIAGGVINLFYDYTKNCWKPYGINDEDWIGSEFLVWLSNARLAFPNVFDLIVKVASDEIEKAKIIT